jgi:hypothetical protein
MAHPRVVEYFCTCTTSKLSSKEAQGVSTEPEEWDAGGRLLLYQYSQ